MTSPATGFGLLERAVSYTVVSAGYATPELLRHATPCARWDLAALLDHVSDSLAVLHEAVGAGYVRQGPAPGGGPDPARDLRCRARTLLAACATARGHEQLVAIADRRLTADVVAFTGAIEISVHGWDIAMACGRNRPIPPLLAAELLRLAVVLVPCAARDGLFADPVWLPAAECPSDQLVAFLGRQPGWPAATGTG